MSAVHNPVYTSKTSGELLEKNKDTQLPLPETDTVGLGRTRNSYTFPGDSDIHTGLGTCSIRTEFWPVFLETGVCFHSSQILTWLLISTKGQLHWADIIVVNKAHSSLKRSHHSVGTLDVPMKKKMHWLFTVSFATTLPGKVRRSLLRVSKHCQILVSSNCVLKSYTIHAK